VDSHTRLCPALDRSFATFRIWEGCKCSDLYEENWIDWDELERARRIDTFRFLESELRSASLTVAEPGGGESWPDQRPRSHQGLRALQASEPSSVQQLPSAPPTQEG
jgi:hypothetical protein